MLAVIGGTGCMDLGKTLKTQKVKTPYGAATVEAVKILDERLLFIPRHGKRHQIPPHRINYRANIAALKKLGASAVFSIHSSGVISQYKPGDLILLKDFIGLNTPITFFDDFSSGIKHADFSQPFDKEFSNAVLEVASSEKIKIKQGGIMATTTGPRFETPAEITALKRLGANLVSMTHAYEATLIKEAEIDYAAIAIGTNYACGIAKKPLSHQEVMERMQKARGDIDGLIGGLLEMVS